MSVAVAAVAGTVAVGAYSANKAAKAQTSAANSANQTQLEMFNVSREDQQPWRDVGGNALNELAYRLGIDGSSTGGTGGSAGGFSSRTPTNSLAGAELVDTSTGVPRPNMDLYETNAAYRELWDRGVADHKAVYRVGYNKKSDAADIEEFMRSGLATQIRVDEEAQRQSSLNDPLYGSLTRNFSEKDFWDDPVTKLGFQFGLDEGTKGLNRQFSAAGSRDSGAALKALTRYATDYTGTKGNEAFNRFNINKDSQFNKLASLAGVGQAASQQIGNQAIATGQGIAQNQIGAGNARAASSIGMANALTGAAGQGLNLYQQNQWLNQRNGGYNGYVGNAYNNGFGDAFTNMSNPAYG